MDTRKVRGITSCTLAKQGLLSKAAALSVLPPSCAEVSVKLALCCTKEWSALGGQARLSNVTQE